MEYHKNYAVQLELKNIFNNNIDIKYDDIITNIFDNDYLNYDLNDVKILNLLGLYHKLKTKNYKKMKEYFLQGVELKDNYSMYELAIYYETIELDENKSKHYHKMNVLNNTSPDILYALGCECETKQQYVEAKKYYYEALDKNFNEAIINLYGILISIDNDDVNAKKLLKNEMQKKNSYATLIIARFYEAKNNIKMMHKFYLMAIKEKNISAILDYCEIIQHQNPKKYVEYLKIAVENNSSKAMFKLFEFYDDNNDNFNANYYLNMSVENGNNNAYNVIRETYTNDILLFNYLSKLNQTSYVSNKLLILQNTSLVCKKYQQNINNIHECIICFEIDVHIPFDCSHEICYNCHVKLKSCPFRCKC